MKKIVKQVVGIDVAQKELVVCMGKMYDDWTPELISHKTFSNTIKGFKSLEEWVKKLADASVPVRYVMEATGVYHESLAYYLDEQSLEVSIVLPNKISNYARTLAVKTVTDKTASEAIVMFGLERNLDQWHRPRGLFKKLRQLTRERSQLVDERTVLKNQLHAEATEAEPSKESMSRMKKRIALLDKQEKEILQELQGLIKTDEEIQQIVMRICTISGVGLLTAATVLGETNGFDLIRNKRQLTSYAGLDVKEKTSGTSVKGKPRISKKGNRNLRKAMHLPALAAIKSDLLYKGIFIRLVAKHGVKMKAAVAVQRKLLEMIYTIYKTGKTYEKYYVAENETDGIISEQLDLLKN
jgi:transposase